MKRLLLLSALLSMSSFAQMDFNMGNGNIGDYEPGGKKDCKTLAFFRIDFPINLSNKDATFLHHHGEANPILQSTSPRHWIQD